MISAGAPASSCAGALSAAAGAAFGRNFATTPWPVAVEPATTRPSPGPSAAPSGLAPVKSSTPCVRMPPAAGSGVPLAVSQAVWSTSPALRPATTAPPREVSTTASPEPGQTEAPVGAPAVPKPGVSAPVGVIALQHALVAAGDRPAASSSSPRGATPWKRLAPANGAG